MQKPGRELGSHPQWTGENNFDNQSIIFPGTEDSERIRINANLKKPTQGVDNFENWLVQGPADNSIKTCYDLFKKSRSNFADLKFLGDRRHGGTEFKYKTYEEAGVLAEKIGSGLIQQCGVKASNDCNVGIFAGNCWEWTVNGIAANYYNYVMVPMYDTLGDQAMRYITNQCDFKTILVDTEARVKNFIKNVQAHPEGRKIDHLVSFNSFSGETAKEAAESGLNLISLETLISNVSDEKIETHNPPSADDIYCICYTSGTTGNPKGVVQTHATWLADYGSVEVMVRKFTTDDSWLSYLPSAHVFERMVQTVILANGGSIGFFGGDPRKLIDDAAAFRPTFFGGVPRVWNKIFGKLEAAQKESWLKQKLIGWAIRSKMSQVEKAVLTKSSIADKLVFGKIQALLGGRVDGAVTGAAPIKNEVLNTLRAAMGTYITEAYGQTECSAGCTATMYGDPRPSVGAPVAAVAIKLVSIPEMNYLRENDQGEICIKGPIVMKGYYKNEEKTREAVDEDGWLHTGDVGQWTEYGTLQIIDRAKHIFKTSLGEYIAPEKIENVYLLHEAVGQIFVYGDSLKDVLVGVVVPCPDNFERWAKGKNIDDLIKNNDLNVKLLKELQDLGKASGLKGFENVKAISFKNEMMTVDSGLLTPTMKTKRPQVKKYFMPLIDEMYVKLGQ